MDSHAFAFLAPLLLVVVGMAAVIAARYLAGAVLAGAVAFFTLCVVLPPGSPKLHALKRFGDAVVATWGRGAAFGKLFVTDLRVVAIAALLAGGVIGVVLILRRQ